MVLGELDLLHILSSGPAGIDQSKTKKYRKQRNHNLSTHRHFESVSNERHGLGPPCRNSPFLTAFGPPDARMQDSEPLHIADHLGQTAASLHAADRKPAGPGSSSGVRRFALVPCLALDLAGRHAGAAARPHSPAPIHPATSRSRTRG